jgi:thymidylate kinase
MDVPHPLGVAIEGPCCAGKTTLGTGLLASLSDFRIAYVKDYSDHVGGGRFLPPPVPKSLEEEERALEVFLRLEAERLRAPDVHLSNLMLIDRSVHTLYAHCFALERKTGRLFFEVAANALDGSSVPLRPSFIFYLDTPNDVVKQRNKAKFPPDSIFIDDEFNKGIREYFFHRVACGHPRIAWLDATMSPRGILDIATLMMLDLLTGGGDRSS